MATTQQLSSLIETTDANPKEPEPKEPKELKERSVSRSDEEEVSDSETIVDDQPSSLPRQITPYPLSDEAPLSSTPPQRSKSNSISKSQNEPPIPDTLDDEKSPSLIPLDSIITSSTQIKRVQNFEELGYSRCKNIANTLQGKTFLATHCDTPDQFYAIKYAAKELYNKGITISKEGKAYNIQEDIVAEGRMMMEFMQHNPPNALIKCYDFFEDDKFYYLSMEYGGSDFFDFVVNCHQLISEGKLSLKEWRKQCKFMFSQLVECIKWLHEEMNYCHLDISLENILIHDNAYFDESTGELNNCLIKLIDFGLAEKINEKCKKYVGKTHYKAPKVYGKKEEFDAKKADIWSLGISLFMMMIGAPPFNKPFSEDPGYKLVETKRITKLLYEWGRIKYVTPNSYDLLERMLCSNEAERITMDEIVSHKWLKIYFPTVENEENVSYALSPSISTNCNQSMNYSNGISSINIMMPQQAVSMSHVATPIAESSTTKYDDSLCYAAVDQLDALKYSKKGQKKRKSKKKFFKLSLSMFGSK